MHKKVRRTVVRRMRHGVAIGSVSSGGDLLGMQANTKHQEQKSTKFHSEQAHFSGFTKLGVSEEQLPSALREGSIIQRMYICKGCFHAHENTYNLITMANQEPSN